MKLVKIYMLMYLFLFLGIYISFQIQINTIKKENIIRYNLRNRQFEGLMETYCLLERYIDVVRKINE